MSDGWFRNGDLGSIDEDGYLHILGRLKDIIIVAGSNVYPSDVEAVLNDCADIREAAIIGRPDEELGEVPVACVVPVPGRRLAETDVTGLFEQRLADYKHPRDVIFLDALPRTATCEVDRTRLYELAGLDAHARDTGSRYPTGSRSKKPQPARN